MAKKCQKMAKNGQKIPIQAILMCAPLDSGLRNTCVLGNFKVPILDLS